jgi:hypothetical protein
MYEKLGSPLLFGGGLGYFTDKITSVDALLLAACGIIIWLSALLEK